jgi:hypothetical protein
MQDELAIKQTASVYVVRAPQQPPKEEVSDAEQNAQEPIPTPEQN